MTKSTNSKSGAAVKLNNNTPAAQQVIGREGETATLLSRFLVNSELREFGFAPRQLRRWVASCFPCCQQKGMSLETIHCSSCNGTGRVWKDDLYNVVCLGCEGSGLIRLTPEQSTQRQRDAEARRLQHAEASERYRIENNKRKEKNKVLLIIGIAIAVPSIVLFVYWFSQLSGGEMCIGGVLLFIVAVIVAMIFDGM